MSITPPPALLVVLSSTSIQFGTAIATTAFAAAGPIGSVWVRGLVGGALLLLLVRPNVRRVTPSQWRAIVLYGVALGTMVLAVYLALEDTSLGIVSAIVMLGPLGVSALGYRTSIDICAVILAAIGVALLAFAHGVSGPISVPGLLYSFIGAAAFGAYILTGKQLGKRMEGMDGLALALVVAVAMQTPLALLTTEPGITRIDTLAILAVAGVLATLVPFVLELNAMRALSAATFGLLLSLEPAIGAVAGFVMRGEQLVVAQMIGIGAVTIASAICVGPRGWTRSLGPRNRELMADPAVAALARVPLFSALATHDLATLAGAARIREAPSGTELTRQGDPGDEFFIVVDGEIRIEVGGREIRRLGPGDFLGEIALVFGGLRTATATVERASKLYVLDRAGFEAMLRRHPRIEDKLLTSVTERMRFR